MAAFSARFECKNRIDIAARMDYFDPRIQNNRSHWPEQASFPMTHEQQNTCCKGRRSGDEIW